MHSKRLSDCGLCSTYATNISECIIVGLYLLEHESAAVSNPCLEKLITNERTFDRAKNAADVMHYGVGEFMVSWPWVILRKSHAYSESPACHVHNTKLRLVCSPKLEKNTNRNSGSIGKILARIVCRAT